MLRQIARKATRLALGFIWLCAFAPLPVDAQQKLTFDIGQSREFGILSIKRGRPDIARAIALGLLQRDPNDIQALLMLSAAQTALNKAGLGVKAGKKALALAKTRADRFTATRLIASGKSKEKQYLQAEFWLRRALQIAPTPHLKNIAKRDFRLVKRNNPLRLNFTFSVAPTSNVNNGSSSDSAWLFGLPFVLSPDAQALSGMEYSAGLRATYRLNQTRTRATDIGMLFYGNMYSLSKSAKSQAPNARASDYSFFTAEAFGKHQRIFNNGRTMLSYSVAAGQNWRGGDALNQYLRLGVEQTHALSNKLTRKLGFSIQHQIPIHNNRNELTTLSLSGALSWRTKGNGKITLGLAGRKASGQNPNAQYDSTKITLDYWFGKPIWGTSISFNLSAENRNYSFSVFNANGREDNRYSAGISMVFTNTQIFGFSPTLDFRATKNSSNIGIFETEAFTTRLGLKSTF